MKRINRTNIQLMNEDDHHDEGSNEEQGDRAPLKEEIKKETIIPLQKD